MTLFNQVNKLFSQARLEAILSENNPAMETATLQLANRMSAHLNLEGCLFMADHLKKMLEKHPHEEKAWEKLMRKKKQEQRMEHLKSTAGIGVDPADLFSHLPVGQIIFRAFIPCRLLYLCTMHYVTVEGLGKSYGIKPLFSNISFHINEGDKIALIARNGSGKSTLLRILSGTETAEEGKVWINKDVNTVLFEQDPQFSESSSILDNIFAHNHPVINAIKKYEAAEDSNDPDKISEALIAMDDHDAWDFDSKVKQILSKLNIHHLDQKVGMPERRTKKKGCTGQNTD